MLGSHNGSNQIRTLRRGLMRPRRRDSILLRRDSFKGAAAPVNRRSSRTPGRVTTSPYRVVSNLLERRITRCLRPEG